MYTASVKFDSKINQILNQNTIQRSLEWRNLKKVQIQSRNSRKVKLNFINKMATSTWDTQNTLRLLLLSMKGSKHCEAQRKKFGLCRATPVGKIGDPQVCEPYAVEFMTCFLSEKVSGQFESLKRATDCLMTNVDKSGITVSGKMDQAFNNCRSPVDDFLSK